MKCENTYQSKFHEQRNQERVYCDSIEYIDQNNVGDDRKQQTTPDQSRLTKHQQDTARNLHEPNEVTVNRRIAEVVPRQPEAADLTHWLVEFGGQDGELGSVKLRKSIKDDEGRNEKS